MPPRDHYRRSSLRMTGYDYTRPGGYFVTIKTYRNRSFLGAYADGHVSLSQKGRIAQALWLEIPAHFHHVVLDEFVILPDHIHGILILKTAEKTWVKAKDGSRENVAAGSLSAIIRSYKSAVTKTVNDVHQTPGKKFWQRNYYDRIIRNEKALYLIRRYIENNAAMHWVELVK